MTIKLLLALTLLATACTMGDNETALPDGGEFTFVGPNNGDVRPTEEEPQTLPSRMSAGSASDVVRECLDLHSVACVKSRATAQNAKPTK